MSNWQSALSTIEFGFGYERKGAREIGREKERVGG